MHNGIVAWLRGEPSLLARRVVAEGIEKRPLLFGEGVSGGWLLLSAAQGAIMVRILASRMGSAQNCSINLSIHHPPPRGQLRPQPSSCALTIWCVRPPPPPPPSPPLRE
jgi:hypothetical protein